MKREEDRKIGRSQKKIFFSFQDFSHDSKKNEYNRNDSILWRMRIQKVRLSSGSSCKECRYGREIRLRSRRGRHVRCFEIFL